MKRDSSLSKLQESIQNDFRKLKGRYALAFKYLSFPNIQLYFNENIPFHAASTMKTPVMIEVFNQASRGVFNITDKITVRNSFKSIYDGSPFSLSIDSDGGEALYNKIGKEVLILDLVYDMITVSSNIAVNILVDLLQAKNINNTVHKLGAVNMKIIRGVEDIKAYEAGLYNTTTAKDLLIIYEQLADKKIISEKISSDMLKILMEQTFNELIPARLPPGLKVAHKTGSFPGLRHDSGIVYLSDEDKYILVVLTENLKEINKAVKTINLISEKIYNFVTSIE